MLFIIVRDVLNRMFLEATRDGVLRKVEPPEIKYQCSFYADSSSHGPSRREATAVKEILHIFGEAFGLKTNLAKWSITPIYGGEEALEHIVQILGCQIQPFPIKYLGLLQTTKKIPKAEVQTVVEAVAWKLPPCHGFLMVRRGRLVWIKSVLRSVPVYTMMAESLPRARKEIDSICRKFFWAGNDNSVHGKCMVAWEIVCRPTELGGLGVSDLRLAGYTLQTWWLSLRQSDHDRAWSQLPINTEPHVQAFFSASTFTVVGDGRQTLFWKDKWIQGDCISDLAPTLSQFVSTRAKRMMTVREGLTADGGFAP